MLEGGQLSARTSQLTYEAGDVLHLRPLFAHGP